MTKLHDAAPSSLRGVAEASRFVQNLTRQTFQPMLLSSTRGPNPSALSRSRFARLPEEPDDAKLTGGTRSLHRRLLALNIGGSLLHGRLLA